VLAELLKLTTCIIKHQPEEMGAVGAIGIAGYQDGL